MILSKNIRQSRSLLLSIKLILKLDENINKMFRRWGDGKHNNPFVDKDLNKMFSQKNRAEFKTKNLRMWRKLDK